MIEWIESMQFVFWGVTWSQLFLMAGRYLLMLSAGLLVMKHGYWFARGYHTHQQQSPRGTWRALIEMAVGGVMAALYAQQLYFDGFLLQLDRWESVVQVWALAVLFIGLVISRGETRPPPKRSVHKE